jgi:hypothetical protein
MTYDDIVEIISTHCTVNDGLDFKNGFAFYEPYVDGIDKAADAIMARLELDNKIALSRGTIELLDLLGVAL